VTPRRSGDRVSFLYGPRRVEAQVVEDRGPIGLGERPSIDAKLVEEAMRREAGSKSDVADRIVAFKRSMAPRRETLRRAFGE
jgi:hypothetical protein